MALFDFLRHRPAPSPEQPVEQLYAVPLAARRLPGKDPADTATYVYYAFLFADSPEAALKRLKREVRDEGFELLQLTGRMETVDLANWAAYVAHNFDWMKDSLPTAAQLASQSHGLVYYSPKIVQK